MALPPIYKIHPAIGIARLGNADRNAFFIGPEFPGRPATGDATIGTTVPDFKSGGKIKPQAARFRVWEYVDKGGKYEASREINLDEKDCVAINWTVHLANRKSSFFNFDGMMGEERAHPAGNRRNNGFVADRRRLEIDPLPRAISGKSKPPVKFSKGSSSTPANELWPNPAPSPPIEYLGELRTDAQGRLIVIGGQGLSSSVGGAPLVHYANNDNWFDDVSDGPVKASIVLRDKANKQHTIPVTGAWVLCGPPDFAPTLASVVTLYDVLYHMAAVELTLPANEALYTTVLKSLGDINKEFKAAGAAKLAAYKPSYNDEIYPFLRRGLEQVFVFEMLKYFHSSVKKISLGDSSAAAQAARQAVFDRLHTPGLAGTGGAKNMPKLQGDEPYKPAHTHRMVSVTPTQFALLEQWVKGNFVDASGVLPAPPPPAVVTPHGLDRAALENCVGAAFYPGIEVSWQVRNKALFSEPFRINHTALSQYLGDATPIRAGHFSRQMAVPWQADFLECRLDGGNGWWPAQRPDIAYQTKADYDASPKKSVNWDRASTGGVTANWPSGGVAPVKKEMVEHWYKFGILREGPPYYHLELEREPTIP